MLSFTKTFTTFPSRTPRAFPHRHVPSHVATRSSIENDNNTPNLDGFDAMPPVQQPPPITPPGSVEIRFKRGSRRRKQEGDGDTNRIGSKKAPVPKDWESMTLNEKLLELYVGEKGALFWLNKFAYASIFIVIGGWIVFRFVGPALNLYQLDTPPLAPTAMFKE
ncbi:hypothetical protein ABFX02_12G068400 [Erythranthe guttata]